MCVLKNFQKKGIGHKLIQSAEKTCRNLNVDYIWMNAREKAVDFYLKLNYIDLGQTYIIKGIGKHSCLYKNLK